MNASTWHFYDSTTGLFSGASYTGPEDDMRLQLEHRGAGVAALAGDIDHLSQRVDIPSGALVDHKPEPPYDGTDLTLYVWWWDKSVKRWQLRPRLKKTKADKWDELKLARDAAEAAGFEWDGSLFDCDDNSQRMITGAVVAVSLAAQAGQPVQQPWTLADNTVRVLSAADMAAVGVAAGAHINTQRAIARDLRVQLEAATSPDQVRAIAWPQG
jgi:hypothetical protein